MGNPRSQPSPSSTCRRGRRSTPTAHAHAQPSELGEASADDAHDAAAGRGGAPELGDVDGGPGCLLANDLRRDLDRVFRADEVLDLGSTQQESHVFNPSKRSTSCRSGESWVAESVQRCRHGPGESLGQEVDRLRRDRHGELLPAFQPPVIQIDVVEPAACVGIDY